MGILIFPYAPEILYCRTELCCSSSAKIYPWKGIRFTCADSQVICCHSEFLERWWELNTMSNPIFSPNFSDIPFFEDILF